MNINNVLMDHGIISSSLSEPAKIYGVKIDTSNSNPETSVTYIDDAVKMAGGSSMWDTIYPFNKIRPVLLKNKIVQSELNKNDFTKDISGKAVDITSGDSGDIFIECPIVYWKFETIGNHLYIRYSNKKVDNSWICLAHTHNGTVKDKLYISAYLGHSDGTKLRSLSGKVVTASNTIGGFRTLAQANGSGYEQMTYGALLMLQILYLVRYKNLDSQTALGRGYVDGNTSTVTTGGTNTKGMYFGETTGKLQMKFAGIEDFWGNVNYWIDGIKTDTNYNVLIGSSNFNNNGTNYTSYSSGLSAYVGGYMNGIQGSTEKGFIVKSASGSATTYYSDGAYLNSSCFAYFGGYWGSSSSAGAFLLRLSVDGTAYSEVGARTVIFM